MAEVLGKFEGYFLRELDEEDYKRLQEWVAADSAHAGVLDAEFFMGEAIDSQGQLAPDPAQDGSREAGTALHKYRKDLQNALFKGMAFLEVGLERAGCTEWIFDSESSTLRTMVQKRMGFAASPNEMVRLIPRITDRKEES
jgi:hypothetical protein